MPESVSEPVSEPMSEPMSEVLPERSAGDGRQARVSRRDLVGVGATVLSAVGLAFLGGWLWWQWWGPADKGRIFETRDGPQWFPIPFDPGVSHVFAGTAEYFLIGLGLGALLGVLAGVLSRSRAVLGLGVLVVASVGAALVMHWFGVSFSPPDPRTLVDSHEIGDRLPGHLELSGWTPYLAWPIGALAGFTGVMLSLSALGGVREQSGDPDAWLRAGAPPQS